MRNNKNFKIMVNIILYVAGLIVIHYLTNLFLISNFEYDGESYYEGYGHILLENFWKGIFFIIIRQLPISILLSHFFVKEALLSHSKRLVFKALIYISLIILALVFIYAGIKTYDVISWGYDRWDRITEITLTWSLRVIGLLLGYFLAARNKIKS
jgi:hypothetical protein